MQKEPMCAMEYAVDSFGKEILLKDGKFQVMMEWEKPYMHACIDALKPFGDVLEIGFGCGYSATHMQSYALKSHTIIEYHPVVAKKAREWAKQYPNVTIIEDTWQNALPSLGVFDAIFFDDYPLESEEQMKKWENSKDQSKALLQKTNQLIQEVEKSFPFLNELVYSDADLQELITHFFQDSAASVKHLSQFLSELHNRNQITGAQVAQVALQLKGRGIVLPEVNQEERVVSHSLDSSGPYERVLLFLSQVLNHHMRIGSRFSCFLNSSASKYEDPRFVDTIICNPLVDYTEELIDIEVPSNCNYYVDRQALVMTITKRG